MLLNLATAQGIADGSITAVLRAWDAPRATAGATQRTQAGTIRIGTITEYASAGRITTAQARAAGYPNRAAALAALTRRPAAHVYVIEVSFLAPDERPALAADDALSDADRAAIAARLDRWDTAASDGPWTRQYLQLIADNEAVRAPGLAARTGSEVARFKARVRRLKGLGLTISLDVGYRISPRGRAFLRGAAAADPGEVRQPRPRRSPK